VLASGAQLLFSHGDGPVLGASGAIMGLAGMYLIFFPVHRVYMAVWLRIWWTSPMIKIWAARGFWVLLFYIAFSGDGVRSDDCDRLRSGAARAERHDARHRVERPARVHHSSRGDEHARRTHDRRHRRRRGARPRAARSQHGDGHGAQSVHRLRRHRRPRETGGEDRSIHQGRRARAEAARRRAARRDPVRGGDDARRGRGGWQDGWAG